MTKELIKRNEKFIFSLFLRNILYSIKAMNSKLFWQQLMEVEKQFSAILTILDMDMIGLVVKNLMVLNRQSWRMESSNSTQTGFLLCIRTVLLLLEERIKKEAMALQKCWWRRGNGFLFLTIQGDNLMNLSCTYWIHNLEIWNTHQALVFQWGHSWQSEDYDKLEKKFGDWRIWPG